MSTRLLWVPAFAVIAVALSACTQSPGINKQFGTYYEWTDASTDRVVDATYAALRDLDINVVGERDAAGPVTKINAVNRYGTEVLVTIRNEGSTRKYGVEVEPGESEGYSLTILNAIRRNLGLSDRK